MEETIVTSEQPTPPPPNMYRQFRFFGNGGTLFGIYLVNFLLTLVTLGFYYPWARAKLVKYLWGETELEGSRFVFHGTGKEMFIGFIKAILIFVGLYAIFFIGIFSESPIILFITYIIFILGLMLLAPLAIHGTMRYRTSRTSWRGIHMGYRGKARELFKKYVIGTLLTIITFGIYGAWFTVDIRKYVMGHIRFGNITFGFDGEGDKLFVIHLKGIILTFLTLGIYMFWYSKELFNYYVEHTYAYQGEERLQFKAYATAGAIFELFIVNYLLLVFTFGFAFAWVEVRNIEFAFKHMVIEGKFDTESLQQTEEDYTDATGDDLFDMLDIDWA